MFYYSDSLHEHSLRGTTAGGGRVRADSIEQTDIDVFECIWSMPSLPDWVLEKRLLQYWLEIGIASSALLSVLLFVNFVNWAISGKVGLFWIFPCAHWLAVGPMVSLRWLWNYDHNRKIILRECGLSPLWADFFGVPSARLYFQEHGYFPCYLYRLETEFKIYPSIVYLFCGIAIHKKNSFLEIVCIFLCLVCISCERLILMRVARYPTDFFIDLVNFIETFSDCYLRCSSIVLFSFSQGDVSLLLIVLPTTLYMFSAVCALAIFLEQKNKRELKPEELRSLFYKSLYYAIPGTIAGYNFSVHLQHTLDRSNTVEHLKSVVIEAITRLLMACMFTSFALDHVPGRRTWRTLFWIAVSLFFFSVIMRFAEVNMHRRRDHRERARSSLLEMEIHSKRPSSSRIISKGAKMEESTPTLMPIPSSSSGKRTPGSSNKHGLRQRNDGDSTISSTRVSSYLTDVWDVGTPTVTTDVRSTTDQSLPYFDSGSSKYYSRS